MTKTATPPPGPPETTSTPNAAVIRIVKGAEFTRPQRLARAQLPAWVISSAIHVSFISVLILFFGLKQTEASITDKILTTQVAPPEETSPPPEDEDAVDFDIHLDVTTDAVQIEQQITEEKLTNDPIAGTVTEKPDALPTMAGTGSDASTAMDGLNGSVLSGSGDLEGLDLAAFGKGGGGTGAASFFGTVSRGSRFAIIADNSNSMKGRPMEYVKAEIINTLTKARGTAHFYVCFFNKVAEPQLIPQWVVTRTNISSVVAWIQGVYTYNGTVPITGFAHVLRLSTPPDVIYFMTDGAFNPKEVAQIRQLNMSLKKPAVIHTIAFKDRRGENLLRQIALDSKGTYRFVESPK